MSACSLQRYVPEGKYLIRKNSIVIDSSHVAFTKSDLATYITQQPYRRSFGSSLQTRIYFISKPRIKSRFWKWVNEKLGKEPDFFDQESTDYSAQQMERFLDNVGYFHSNVTTEVTKKGFKARVKYHVTPATPYRISEISYDIADTVLADYALFFEKGFPVKKGDIYNEYTMNDHRDLITEHLRNSGYYYFNRNYIVFEVDSSQMNHTIKVKMRIDNVKDPETGKYTPHKRYYINKISIYPNFSPAMASRKPTDSTHLDVKIGRQQKINSLDCYYFGNPRIRPQTFSQVIQIQKGEPYRLWRVNQTYSNLRNFQLFTNPNIEFTPVASDTANLLDCRIMLQRNDVHSYRIGAEGTNSDRDLGIRGSLSYTNKNLFKGAEIFTISVKGGLEAQQIVGFGELENHYKVFNTREFSINSNLYFPKFLSPLRLRNFVRDYQPSTNLALGYNAQIRYYYSRYIAMASFGYDWKSTPRLQHVLKPFYLNSVKVNPIPEFQAMLDMEDNQRRKDQYTNHLIFGAQYAFTLNTQNINRTGNFIYLRASIESSGNLLSLFNNTSVITEREGHHELFGIRYAQFLRTHIDFRQYLSFNEDTRLVFRQVVGVGFPYGNSMDMPFERSFYSGGANGMRGWPYRMLGPGAYHSENNEKKTERIGDIQVELNTEFRFPIYSIIKGAFFVDAGNIWNYHENEALPNGGFKFDTFYRQIAMDGGLGLRFDVNIIVLRLDCAMPFRNPYSENGTHWRFKNMHFRDMRWVISIGYPF